MDNKNNFFNDDDLVIKQDNKKDSKKSGFGKQVLKTFFKYFLIGVMVLAVFSAGYLTHYFSLDKDLISLNFLLTTYKNHYYKAQDGDITDVIVDCLMDDYSEFYTKEEYQEVVKSSNGDREGYGFSINNSTLTFSQISWNSPAEKAGLMQGDVLKKYKVNNGDYVAAENSNDFINFLNECSSADTVTLSVLRNAIDVVTVSMQKAKYTETYVRYADNSGCYAFLGENKDITFEKVDNFGIEPSNGWAYIKLSRFNGRLSGLAGASGQFERALKQFKSSGNKKLIIDLRSNGGGYMSILCEIASHLCYDGEKDGKSLVCQTAIYGDGKQEEFKTKATDYLSYGYEKIVFLANSGSASASEALMGAVLDYDKKSGNNIVNVVLESTETESGLVYKTYGKGIMQSTIVSTLTGEALKLTTAQIYWPVSKTTIHGVGLTKDIDSRILQSQGDALTYAQTL